MDYLLRTQSPFWKFKPCLLRNDGMGRWEACLSQGGGYVKNVSLPCQVTISRDGKVVEVFFNDEALEKLEGPLDRP